MDSEQKCCFYIELGVKKRCEGQHLWTVQQDLLEETWRNNKSKMVAWEQWAGWYSGDAEEGRGKENQAQDSRKEDRRNREGEAAAEQGKQIV